VVASPHEDRISRRSDAPRPTKYRGVTPPLLHGLLHERFVRPARREGRDDVFI